MKPVEKNVIVLELADRLREKGSWCGETHVQKAVYFLQELLKVQLDFDFVLYKHGPFSFELQDELVSLRAYELLELEPQPNGYGPKLILSESGRALEQKSLGIVNQYSRQIDWLAGQLGKEGVVRLERLGTALYVSREKQLAGKSEDEIITRVVELKPHVTKDQAELALREIRKMEKESQSILA